MKDRINQVETECAKKEKIVKSNVRIAKVFLVFMLLLMMTNFLIFFYRLVNIKDITEYSDSIGSYYRLSASDYSVNEWIDSTVLSFSNRWSPLIDADIYTITVYPYEAPSSVMSVRVWGNQSRSLRNGIPVDLCGMIDYDTEAGMYCLYVNRFGTVGNILQMLLALVASGVVALALFRVCKFGVVFSGKVGEDNE